MRLQKAQVRAVLNKVGASAPTTITAVTLGVNPTVTSALHGLQTGDAVVIANAAGPTAGVNGFTAGITVVDANSFQLTGNTSVGAYTSGGTVARVFSTLKPSDVDNLTDTLERVNFIRGSSLEPTVQAALEGNSNL